MCYFITVGLPEDKAPILETHVPRGFHIAPVFNRSVLRQMGDGFSTYLLMSGGCSCGLFFEPSGETEEDCQAREDSRQERLRHKYEKKGWTTAKIERALTQRPREQAIELPVGLRGDVQRFLGELAMSVGQLAVVVHWYDDDLEEAKVVCKEGKVISAQAAMEERLRLEANEIGWIKVGK